MWQCVLCVCVCVSVCVCVCCRKKIGRALDQRYLHGLAGEWANAGSPREVVDGGPPAVEVQEAEADEEGLHSTLHRQPVTAGVDKAVLHNLKVRLHRLRSPTAFAVTVPPHQCQRALPPKKIRCDYSYGQLFINWVDIFAGGGGRKKLVDAWRGTRRAGRESRDRVDDRQRRSRTALNSHNLPLLPHRPTTFTLALFEECHVPHCPPQ